MEQHKRLTKVLIIGFFILLINSSYLGAYADPTVFYFGNLAFHMALGLGLALLYGYYLVSRSKQLPRLLLVSSAIIGAGAFFGIFLMIFGAVHSNWWAIYLHVSLGAAGSTFILAHLFINGRSYVGSGKRALAYSIVTCIVFIFPLASAAFNRYSLHARDRIVNPDLPPVSMQGEGGGPGSPFFPSSAGTNVGGTIPSNFFMTSQECGRCHKDIYEQWKSSMHHFSSFNNQWYRKSI